MARSSRVYYSWRNPAAAAPCPGLGAALAALLALLTNPTEEPGQPQPGDLALRIKNKD